MSADSILRRSFSYMASASQRFVPVSCAYVNATAELAHHILGPVFDIQLLQVAFIKVKIILNLRGELRHGIQSCDVFLRLPVSDDLSTARPCEDTDSVCIQQPRFSDHIVGRTQQRNQITHPINISFCPGFKARLESRSWSLAGFPCFVFSPRSFCLFAKTCVLASSLRLRHSTSSSASQDIGYSVPFHFTMRGAAITTSVCDTRMS